MINISFSIRNPWSNHFDSGRVWHGRFGHSNKSWEIQIMRTTDIVSFEFGFTIRQDHAGIRFELGLFGRNICIQVYDVRHWNDEKGCWKVYD